MCIKQNTHTTCNFTVGLPKELNTEGQSETETVNNCKHVLKYKHQYESIHTNQRLMLGISVLIYIAL